MNYLDLINKCLTELNYKQVNSFDELVKNDHKKIKNILNLINVEVCRLYDWNFLLRKTSLTLPRNTGELLNSVNGKFAVVFIDGVKYHYYPNFQKFLTNTQPPCTYSLLNDKLLFPIFSQDKNIEIVYYTGNSAITEDNTEAQYLSGETDCSLIPETFAEPILVYGTCMRMKANPQHVKFSYWLSMYNDALANLKSKNKVSIDEYPTVKLLRY